MKKIIKIIIISTFIIIFVVGLLFYLHYGNIIKINGNIKNDITFCTFKNKQLFFKNSNEQINTDFTTNYDFVDSIYVLYECFVQKDLHFIPNSITIRFISGNGFGGSEIDIIKTGILFGIKQYHYSDEINSNFSLPKIKQQTLILDKENYEIGDSIFGKVEITFQEYFEGQKETYQGGGFFCGVVK